MPENLGKVSLASEIYAVNNNYIVKISADRPTLLAIGTETHQTRKPTKESSNVTENASSHGTMQINVNRAAALCLSCHKKHNNPGSHPVDVSPKSGMIIPADYPTSPSGKITCLTCHDAHASNLKFMLRKSHKRELCVGCHSDKDKGRNSNQLMVKVTNRNPNNS